MPAATRASLAVPIAALAVILSRFAPPLVPGVAGDVAQAAWILTVTLVLVAVGLARMRGRADLGLESPLMAGAFLYGGAATLGAAVALARGNDPKFAAGQLLSMGLVPLAALGCRWNGGAAAFRRLAAVVCAYSGALCAAGFAWGLVQIARGRDPLRFRLPDGSAPTGSAIAAILLAVALATASSGWRRRLALTAAGFVSAYVVVSSVRSLWIAAACALVCFAPLAWGRARVARVPVIARAAGLVVLTAAALAGWFAWWGHARPDLMGWAPSSANPSVVAATRAPLAEGTYRVRGTVAFDSPGRVTIEIRRAGSEPLAEPSGILTVAGTRAAGTEFTRVVILAPPAGRIEVALADPSGGGSSLAGVTVERLGPAWVGGLVVWVSNAAARPPDPDAGPGAGAFTGDASIAFRLKESRAALGGFARAGWPARLLGHGLGARLDLSADGYDGHGRVIHFDRPNYIHNFYLFLLFKLGILGTLTVLAALLLWIATPAVAAVRLPPGDPRRVALAACAALWVGYSVWALAGPEILDFRLATVWGLLLAATPLNRAENGAPAPTGGGT